MTKHLNLKEKYPTHLRPRERLQKHGVKVLSDQELLAIILRTGTQKMNVVDLALRVLQEFEGLFQIKDASIEELTKIPGIGVVKAMDIIVTSELGYRMARSEQTKNGQITSSQGAGNHFIKEMHGLQQEHVIALYLNTKNEVIKQYTVFIGSLNTSVAHPREIFKGAVKYSAARIILAHNHPSGNPDPSQADYAFTKRMVEAGELMGIEVLDHFVIGSDTYISLKEYGWI